MSSERQHVRRRASLMTAGVMALTVAAAGCDEGLLDTEDGDDLLPVSELTITAADAELVEGATSHFQAEARTSTGVNVDTATITWASRDESVATVGANTGTVTAVMDGETYIVAGTGAGETVFSDSVLVTVLMPAVTSVGQAEFRIRGDVTESHSWGASGWMGVEAAESLGPSSEDDIAWMEVYADGESDDLAFVAVFPGTSDFSTGTIDLVSWDVALLADYEIEAVDGPVAVFFYEETDDYGLFYANTSGSITIESIEGEPGYGEDAAADMIAFIEMEAEEYRWTDEIVATGATVQIKGRVGVAYFKSYRGYSTITLSGEASLDTQGHGGAFITSTGGLEMTVDGYADLSDGRERSFYLDTHLASPGTGTFAVDSIDWTGDNSHLDFVDGVYSIYDSSAGEYEFDWYLWSRSGSIAVERYDGAGGVIEGTSTVRLGVFDWATDEQVGEVQAEVNFIVPVKGYDADWTAASFPATPERSGIQALLRQSRRPEPPTRR